MITNQHPITPPPELVQEWWVSTIPNQSTNVKTQLCIQAAQWGADQELEACCELVPGLTNYLRAARRPKPLSLKEQALRDLDALAKDLERNGMGFGTAMIRRALEALDD